MDGDKRNLAAHITCPPIPHIFELITPRDEYKKRHSSLRNILHFPLVSSFSSEVFYLIYNGMSIFSICGAVLLMYIYVIMEHKIDNVQETPNQNANPAFMFIYAFAFSFKAMSTAGVLTAKCQNY
jgi:hypothetical protein